MALDYTISHEGSIVRVRVAGSWDYLAVDRLWRDIGATCKEFRCLNILGVSNTQNWTDSAPYDYPAFFRAAGITPQHRIAWVQENAEAKAPTELAGAVVRNRKLASARVFESVGAAQRWLAGTAEHQV